MWTRKTTDKIAEVLQQIGVPVSANTVARLLYEQHADLASLALFDAGEGWDNHMFRLGEDLALRMPRREASAALIEKEQRWLPEMSTRLPLPIRAPLRIGRPGCGYPWSWSVVPWLPRQSALTAPFDSALIAPELGRFLNRMHQPAPEDAPRNPWRGVPLTARDQSFRKHLQQLQDVVDREPVLRLWRRALSTPRWSGPALWIHGDLHLGNLIVSRGRLSGVIDFGDLTASDPATDLAVMWMMFPSEVRPAFLCSSAGAFDPCDEQTVVRARG